MPALFAQPVVCPVLIGRTAAVDTLHQRIDVVHAGCSPLLIAGEAGVGKTRLVAEATAYAAAHGLLVLQGACFPQDSACPYAPLLDLLHRRFAGQPPAAIAAAIGPLACVLASLLPELLPAPSELPPLPPLGPEQEQRRLFAALAQCLSPAAAPRPVLLVVEDLHWSDEGTLDFLLYLVRRAALPLLLIGTYRSDEVPPHLQHWLAELDRAHLAEELLVPPLTRDEVGALLRATFGLPRPVRAEFRDAIDELAEGNPFYIEELLKALVAAGDIFYTAGGWDRKALPELRLPRSLRAAVQQRVVLLSAAAREVLALAAVVGRRFDFALLQRLTQHDEATLLQLLKELIGAQLVVEASAEQFAFRHALTRQAIYSELLARERQALHRRIAEALEDMYADARERQVGDLAYHFYAAGVWARALDYAQRAGAQAQTFYAPRAAIEHFTRALDAAAQLPQAPTVKIYRARAEAYETLGDFARARVDHEAALALARAAGDRHAEWQALLDLGFLWASRDYSKTGEYYRQALELAHTMSDAAVLAHSLNRLGNWYANVEQPLLGWEHHEEALAIFERLGDQRGIATTLDLLGAARCCSGDLLGSMAVYDRAATLLRELDDRSTLVLSLALLTSRAGDGHFDPLVPDGAEFGRAIAAGEEARAIARAIEWPAGEAFASAQFGHCLATRGEYARALAAAQDACRIAGEIEHRQWLAFTNEVLGRLYLDLLALPAARQHLEQALLLAREVGSLIWIHAAGGALIATCVQQGDLARAEAVRAAVPDLESPPQSFGQLALACACVELALAQGEPAEALQRADQVYTSLALEASGGRRRVGPPHLGRLRAEALAALGAVAEAEALLQADLAAAHTRGCLPLLWRLHVTLGRLYRADGRRAEAERELAAAHTIIEELAAKVPDQPVAALAGGSLRDHFLQSATALVPGPHPLRPPLGVGPAVGDLTPREVEVLRLLATGQSNREIAGALVISVRTVEHHIASIYGKIGARRRADAATYALRHGLLPATQPDR